MASMGRPVLSVASAQDALYQRVLCVVDDSHGSAEAVSQALSLLAPAGRMKLSAAAGSAPAAEAAVRTALAHGVPAMASMAGDDRSLVQSAGAYDLLVVPAPGRTRALAIVLGSTASFAVHAAH